MARTDWRSYFMPAFETPYVIYPATFYLDREQLLAKERSRGGRVIGIWRVKGKTPKVQQELWKRSY